MNLGPSGVHPRKPYAVQSRNPRRDESPTHRRARPSAIYKLRHVRIVELRQRERNYANGLISRNFMMECWMKDRFRWMCSTKNYRLDCTEGEVAAHAVCLNGNPLGCSRREGVAGRRPCVAQISSCYRNSKILPQSFLPRPEDIHPYCLQAPVLEYGILGSRYFCREVMRPSSFQPHGRLRETEYLVSEFIPRTTSLCGRVIQTVGI